MSMDSLCNNSSSTSWPSQKYVKWVVMAHFVTVDYVESQSECTAGSVAKQATQSSHEVICSMSVCR